MISQSIKAITYEIARKRLEYLKDQEIHRQKPITKLQRVRIQK